MLSRDFRVHIWAFRSFFQMSKRGRNSKNAFKRIQTQARFVDNTRQCSQQTSDFYRRSFRPFDDHPTSLYYRDFLMVGSSNANVR